MLKNHPSILMIEIAAKGIQSIPELDAVFVGGATTCLYIDDESLGQVRHTKDVDCTIEVTSYSTYCHLEDLLRKNDFKHVSEEGAPLCRWRYQGVIIDIMPDDETVIGFTNSWYREGREHRLGVTLPSGRTIFIFPLEYFIASKIEAFNKRGNGDFYGSKDIEDIITILDGTLHFETILNKENRATDFVKDSFNYFLGNSDFVQSLTGHIDNGDIERAKRIYNYLKLII
jgi:hypothetical protein